MPGIVSSSSFNGLFWLLYRKGSASRAQWQAQQAKKMGDDSFSPAGLALVEAPPTLPAQSEGKVVIPMAI
jgi:hypothetical protein